MIELLILVVGAVIGFVVGVLVYNNNKSLLEKKILEAEAMRDKAEEIANKVEAELKALKAKK